jgi:hypothetical protein
VPKEEFEKTWALAPEVNLNHLHSRCGFYETAKAVFSPLRFCGTTQQLAEKLHISAQFSGQGFETFPRG